MISNDQAFAQAAQNAHPGQSNGQFEMRESAIERTKSRLDKYRKTAEKKTIDENAFLEAKLRQDMQENVFTFEIYSKILYQKFLCRKFYANILFHNFKLIKNISKGNSKVFGKSE